MDTLTATTRPEAPQFDLRHLGWVAYGMSVGTGALGQILFLGTEFGGKPWSYAAAVGLAAFAEVVMAAAGDKSLDHRANRRAWKSLLILGVVVACYAAAMNVIHFIRENPALAFTFGGASLIGFLLHVIDGHIKVAAYLRDDDAYRAHRAEAEKPAALEPTRPRVEAPVPASRPATPSPAAAPVTTTPSPGAAAATTVAPKPPSNAENVRELHPQQPSKREQGRTWFRDQVIQHGRDPEAISAAEVDAAIGANGYCKKHIQVWRDEIAAELTTAVNE